MKSLQFMLMLCAMLLASCASDKSSEAGQTGTGPTDIKAGMTKREVTGILGSGHSVQRADDGETWVYRTPKVQIVHFDKDGKVDRSSNIQ